MKIFIAEKDTIILSQKDDPARCVEDLGGQKLKLGKVQKKGMIGREEERKKREKERGKKGRKKLKGNNKIVERHLRTKIKGIS